MYDLLCLLIMHFVQISEVNFFRKIGLNICIYMFLKWVTIIPYSDLHYVVKIQYFY